MSNTNKTEKPEVLAGTELKNLYFFVSNNLPQIGAKLTDAEKVEFWVKYQLLEMSFIESIFLGLASETQIKSIRDAIKAAKEAADKLLLGMQSVTTSLNAITAAIDTIAGIKNLIDKDEEEEEN